MKEKLKTSIMLFFNSMMISGFTFGGGYVIVSMMRKKYVHKKKLLTEEEMMDITTMAQASPGPIAVNTNLLLGFKLAGMLGAICCLLGTMIPPLVVITIIFHLQELLTESANLVVDVIMTGMGAGIAAIITDVVFSLLIVVKKERNKWAILTFPLTFALAFTFTHFKINIVFIIVPAFILAIAITFFEKWRIDMRARLANPKVVTCDNRSPINIEYDKEILMLDGTSDVDAGFTGAVIVQDTDIEIHSSVNLLYDKTEYDIGFGREGNMPIEIEYTIKSDESSEEVEL